MELILSGYALLDKNWHVIEDYNPGYVRVYKIQSGLIRYIDENQEKLLSTGQVYLLPSHSTYRMSLASEEKFICTWIHINLDPIILNDLVEINQENCPLAYKTFGFLEELIVENERDPIAIEKCMDLFLYYCNQKKMLPPTSPLVLPILQSFSEGLVHTISIKDIAKKQGYTPEHYIRIFKEDVGLTPLQYVINYKMSVACHMLRTHDSITEIAERIGYQDIKTFERAFKKVYGKTPSNYRNTYKKNI